MESVKVNPRTRRPVVPFTLDDPPVRRQGTTKRKAERGKKSEDRDYHDWTDRKVQALSSFDGSKRLGAMPSRAEINQMKQRVREAVKAAKQQREPYMKELIENLLGEEPKEPLEKDEDDDPLYCRLLNRQVADFKYDSLDDEPAPFLRTYFEPIAENVEGSDEEQLTHCPYVDDNTDDMSVCSGLYKAYPNGIHGYIDNEEEMMSDQLLFETMKILLMELDKKDDPQVLYYALYSVFPNFGSQKQMSEKFPELAALYTEDDNVLQDLLKLEPWKSKKDEEAAIVPLSRGNFFVMSLHYPINKAHEKCSDDCFKLMGAAEMRAVLQPFLSTEQDTGDIELFINKATRKRDSPFLTDLLLRSGNDLIGKFCNVAKHFKEKTCSGWFKLVLSIADSQVEEHAISFQQRDQAFRQAMLGVSTRDIAEVGANPTTCCHFGPCGKDVKECACKIMCSDNCQCDSNCSRKFPGCRCKANRCGTVSCSCFKLNRECREQTCKTCLQTKEGETVPSCQNNQITRGTEKAVKLGLSMIAGNGAFLEEDVAKGDYLGEYVGEHISAEETDRRGKLYDLETSYIFGIPGTDESIDATRAGNVFRFVNHSDHPNCYIQVKIVNGKPRIGFFAAKKMCAGTELTFNYCYNSETAEKFFKLNPADRVPKREVLDDGYEDSKKAKPKPRSRKVAVRSSPRSKKVKEEIVDSEITVLAGPLDETNRSSEISQQEPCTSASWYSDAVFSSNEPSTSSGSR